MEFPVNNSATKYPVKTTTHTTRPAANKIANSILSQDKPKLQPFSDNRTNRFRGQYVIQSSLPPASGQPTRSTDLVAEKQPMMAPSCKLVVTNPLCKTANRCDGPRRSEKRSAPFTVVNVFIVSVLIL